MTPLTRPTFPPMNTLATLISVVALVLTFIIWVLVGQAVLSWLIAFNVLSMRSNGVRQLANMLDRLTAPLLRPIRRVLPDMGGIDLSPMALILVIIILRDGLLPDIAGLVV